MVPFAALAPTASRFTRWLGAEGQIRRPERGGTRSWSGPRFGSGRWILDNRSRRVKQSCGWLQGAQNGQNTGIMMPPKVQITTTSGAPTRKKSKNRYPPAPYTSVFVW